ncbi:MAG: hypothetical protein ACRCT8_02240 [Lacipirellulaceae bacterium]
MATGVSTLTFHDNVSYLPGSGSGGLTVQAGSRAVFLGGLSIGASSLAVGIAGNGSVSDLGLVEVVGVTTFTGSPLDVILSGGFVPSRGDIFGVLSSTGPITGRPVLRSAPPIAPGLRWDLVTTRNQVLLRVVDATPGDFNGDGLVNGADYSVWRDNLSATGEGALNGGGNGDGVVNWADHAMWAAHYGEGALTGTPIPEPAACLLLGLGVLAANGTRARR